MRSRKVIKPGTTVHVRLSRAERDLIVDRALLDRRTEIRLNSATVSGASLVVPLTLDEVEDLHGCVATEANHSKVPKERTVFSGVCGRLTKLLDTFTDEAPASLVNNSDQTPFTEKQGQFLAFIYYYTKIHHRPPAESDFQAYFRTSPPAVHDMILTLERRALIDRVPGQARSIRLRLARWQLPDLI